MGKLPEITPEQHKLLNKLAQEFRNLRLQYAEAAKQHRSNAVNVGILKGQKEAAKQAHVEAYLALGFSRQQEWQRERISQGQCRLCGNPSQPGRKHCELHDPQLKRNMSGARKKRGAMVEQ